MARELKFQRRHFQFIADVVRGLDFLTPLDRHGVAEAFASELRRTNPQFDRERFLAACHVREG